ncbi:MAG: hypothetical protein QNJ72_02345 [Pleurocapsa sp. MO_226.B13]|nr:hypothetical protein [Pleurocapsa sp. MO_226.B13]
MNNINLKSDILRAVWSSVEAINKRTLLQLDDTDLIHQIMRQVDDASILTSEDRQSLIDYIKSKVLLIRDIADSEA